MFIDWQKAFAAAPPRPWARRSPCREPALFHPGQERPEARRPLEAGPGGVRGDFLSNAMCRKPADDERSPLRSLCALSRPIDEYLLALPFALADNRAPTVIRH